ncbi:hypothetical protein QLQ15_01930 [Lysobacter sp. LF1]|uniref:DUF4175 domain-containing protein n=1 Tax=Lysobacter stagni TaxID=3045172 RepID=A0ABT6XC00_9GAMM|nr:hypothetical protein [Lysobacter sp. LF1]MDI9237666.1 hypothetical protein [Lysobacter sp. LF1]
MNVIAALNRRLAGARFRLGADTALRALPWVVVATALAWRISGVPTAVVVLLVCTVVASAWALRASSALDTAWLVRELDRRRRDLDDSADLLFAPDAKLSGLERLQRARLVERLEESPAPDLRPAWSTRPHVIGTVLGALAIAAIVLWPVRPRAAFEDVVAQVTGEVARPTHTRVLDQQLHVTPPAYTRQAARDEPTLDAKAPQGTRLQWAYRFAPQPTAAELVFHDGRRVALHRDGDVWRGEHVLVKSALYRLELRDSLPLRESKAHRLDAIADRPPQVRVLEPDRSLSLITPGQRSWNVAFEASDDYGIAPSARLRITLAQGSGENITFREHSATLAGSGNATTRRYTHRLDLAALGLAAGDDLIVQLDVNDNRAPSPQNVRSASLILRWPSDLGTETSGLEGMVKKVLPAYFRSQRQIIIDAEALLKEKRTLPAERFLQRSDAIGVDQRILRLRYGQFLGEEAEGAPKPPPTSDANAATGDHEQDGTAQESGHDDHDHVASEAPSATFGQEGSVLEEYGHTHDHAEAATLLDPETRTILKAALDAMWQSELHLRQGDPKQALPHAYRALARIKEVQQASRIYLARVGPELPPIDESRRMGGDRAGIDNRAEVMASATAPDPTLSALWRALDDSPSTTAQPPVDFPALERWLRANESRIADPLSFIAAVEALRADPQCARCRDDLRAQLWPLLPRPATSVPRRDDGDASGRRYLDALRGESAR